MIPLIQSNPIQSKPQLEGGGGGVHQPPLSLNRSSLPPAHVFWVHRTCTLGQTGMFPWEPTMLPGRVGRGGGEEGRCILLFVACFKEIGFRVSNGLGPPKGVGSWEGRNQNRYICCVVLGWVNHGGASQGETHNQGGEVIWTEDGGWWDWLLLFYALEFLLLKNFLQCVCWWCCTHVAILISRVVFHTMAKKTLLVSTRVTRFDSKTLWL